MSSGPSIEALEANYDFPTAFTAKAIGPNTESFFEDIKAATHQVFPAEGVSLTGRESTKGTYLSVQVTVQAEGAEQVIELYAALQTVADLKTLL